MQVEFEFEDKKYILELYERANGTSAIAIDIWIKYFEIKGFEYYQTSWRSIKDNCIQYDEYDLIYYPKDVRNIFDRYLKQKVFW